MRKNKVIPWAIVAILMTLTVPAWGQEKDATQKPANTGRVGKVIRIKYADPQRIRNLLMQFAPITIDDQMKVLTVVGTPAEVEAVEEAVAKLDVPPPPVRNVELTAYYLMATPQATQASDLPPDLDEVATQLKKVLNFRGFHLLNTTLVRIRDGEEAQVHGAAGHPPTGADFGLSIRRMDVGGEEKEPTIHLRGLSFSISESPTTIEPKGAATKNLSHAELRTDIDIPVGQKVVVGKTSFEMSDNAVVLVLTAKVVD
jgi:hypothetical protein